MTERPRDDPHREPDVLDACALCEEPVWLYHRVYLRMRSRSGRIVTAPLCENCKGRRESERAQDLVDVRVRRRQSLERGGA